MTAEPTPRPDERLSDEQLRDIAERVFATNFNCAHEYQGQIARDRAALLGHVNALKADIATAAEQLMEQTRYSNRLVQMHADALQEARNG